MEHPLDRVLAALPLEPLSVRLPLNLGELTQKVGALAWMSSGRPDVSFPQPSDSRGRDLMCNRLLNIARYCCAWAGVADPVEAMREEYDRACVLHPGMTLDSPEPSDAQRFAAVVEELGEVARATTYDAQTDRGHAGDRDTELIQLGALAAAWATRYTTEEA